MVRSCHVALLDIWTAKHFGKRLNWGFFFFFFFLDGALGLYADQIIARDSSQHFFARHITYIYLYIKYTYVQSISSKFTSTIP
ncbi:hypothetical protein F5X97DRAFT_44854 [Nemania serpens]|nr:hypothetical protein F5X97DRAFT_44854 [Nemania serpens]